MILETENLIKRAIYFKFSDKEVEFKSIIIKKKLETIYSLNADEHLFKLLLTKLNWLSFYNKWTKKNIHQKYDDFSHSSFTNRST